MKRLLRPSTESRPFIRENKQSISLPTKLNPKVYFHFENQPPTAPRQIWFTTISGSIYLLQLELVMDQSLLTNDHIIFPIKQCQHQSDASFYYPTRTTD